MGHSLFIHQKRFHAKGPRRFRRARGAVSRGDLLEPQIGPRTVCQTTEPPASHLEGSIGGTGFPFHKKGNAGLHEHLLLWLPIQRPKTLPCHAALKVLWKTRSVPSQLSPPGPHPPTVPQPPQPKPAPNPGLSPHSRSPWRDVANSSSSLARSLRRWGGPHIFAANGGRTIRSSRVSHKHHNLQGRWGT